MRFAITSDLHLTERSRHPERFHALEDILKQLADLQITDLLIAGDLFDSTPPSEHGLADFEEICRQAAAQNIRFSIVPGNHDLDLNSRMLVGENITFYDKPRLATLVTDSPPLLFIPYRADSFMSEQIADFAEVLQPDKWILVSHGDWLASNRQPAAKDGLYMPLTGRDVKQFQPQQVFLGHQHYPSDTPVCYPGSPCGLDITETGRRRFVIYDSSTQQLESRLVHSDVLFFNERFTMLPVVDEKNYLQEQIVQRIATWNLAAGEIAKVRLRVCLQGFCADRQAALETTRQAFADFSFYQGEEPDLSALAFSDDSTLQQIAQVFKERLEQLDWQPDSYDPDKEQIMLQALNTIYGA